MRSYRFGTRSIPYLFAFITIIAYGLLLQHTGFYWDDWPFAWIAEFLGPKEFLPAFMGVRPLLGPIFFVTTSLIPPIPIYWQIFALVIRFLSGISVWFALSQVWTHHKRQALIAALLFLVFPGYSQHWVAFTHINQEWIPFIFYLLSFGFTARALRNPDKFTSNTIWALILTAAGVFPTEYFIGLEPLRFLFIWVIIAEEAGTFRQRSIQALKRWWPYLLVWLGNAAWLAYFYTIGSYDSYNVEIASEPLNLLQLSATLLDALWKAGIYAWGQVIWLITDTITAPSSISAVGLIVITFILVVFYLTKLDIASARSRVFAHSALFIGTVGILLGRMPSFAAGLPLTLQSSNDRFMISMMLGGSLFIAGFIELLIKNPRIKTWCFALLIALGVGQQFFNANIFRRDWMKQQEIYSQLAWRIPALEPNTLLLTDQLPLDYETDISMTAPLNWLYAPEYTRSNLPYAMMFSEIRLGGTSLPALEQNIMIDVGIRTVWFHGSTSQTVVFYMPENGCLQVLDAAQGDQYTYGNESPFLVDAIPLSRPENIIASNETPHLEFLPELEHTWCYYYLKAELAHQQKDWATVVYLIDEALKLGYVPENSLEWLSYIEAQAMLGNSDIAKKMTDDLLAREKGIRNGLCEVWKRVQAQVPAGGDAEFQFGCEK